MRRSTSEKVFNMINTIFMVVLLIICLYPLYYMIIYSISAPEESAKGLILFPKKLTTSNYQNILTTGQVVTGFVVSVLRAVTGTILTVMCSSIVSYIVTKKDLPFRKVIYKLLVITMYLSAGLIPWYMVMIQYGLKNNFLLYIIPSMINVYSVILVKTYIEEAIPQELEESAMIDGAGLCSIFFKVILPLSIPILAAIALFSAVSQWNSWMDNLFLVSNPKLKTLQLVLYEYMNQTVPASAADARFLADSMSAYRPTANSVRMTIAVITILPILCVYPFLQKYFVKGLMVGAVKG